MVVVGDVLPDEAPQLAFGDEGEMVQTLTPSRSNKLFSLGVEIEGGDDRWNVGDAVGTVVY